MMAWRTATLLLGVLLTWSQGTTATSSEATVVVTLREISRYQASSLPVLDITTPETHYPIAFSHPNKPLPSCTKNETRSTTPYPEPSHWTSHICHNTTITYTLYQSTSTSTASSSRYCTSNSTTTVTVPWPSIGMGHRPSVTGGAQPPYNNGTYHSPSTSTKPPPYRTGMPTDSIRSFELERQHRLQHQSQRQSQSLAARQLAGRRQVEACRLRHRRVRTGQRSHCLRLEQ